MSFMLPKLYLNIQRVKVNLYRKLNLLTIWRIFGELFLANWHVRGSLGNCVWRTDTLATLCRIFDEFFWRTDTLANLWRMVFGELTRSRIFGELFFTNWHVCESLANLWGIVFGELTRWRNLGESLGSRFWGTDTLASHWRIFGELFLANWHVGESLANLWGMVFANWHVGESLGNIWWIFLANWHVGKSLGNGFCGLRRSRMFDELFLNNCFWRTITLANLWQIFGEWFLANWDVGEYLANSFWQTDTLANLWRIFGESFSANWHVDES